MKFNGFDNDAEARLRTSFGELLDLTSGVTARARSTFSGSIALERVFIAVREYARLVGKGGLTAILPEPSIDLSYLLLKEHPDVLIKGVTQKDNSSASRVDRLIEEIVTQIRRSPSRQVLVVLDSPSNPLGFVTGAEDLKRLAIACGRFEAVLVVDHCFLLAGLHAPSMLPSVFGLSDEVCNWIGVWDSGKSIDVSGDKIGLIVPGNPRMSAVVDGALAVIQPSSYAARRAIEVFSRLLGAPELRAYLAEGGRVCHSNLKRLQAHVQRSWSVPTPAAGTFACVYAPDSKRESDRLRADWLALGVSTAAGRTFFPDTFSFIGEGTPFLRVSLLRDPEFFSAALRRLPGVSVAIE
jgi:aspartate/methionine/tyrosine aminotransferase